MERSGAARGTRRHVRQSNSQLAGQKRKGRDGVRVAGFGEEQSGRSGHSGDGVGGVGGLGPDESAAQRAPRKTKTTAAQDIVNAYAKVIYDMHKTGAQNKAIAEYIQGEIKKNAKDKAFGDLQASILNAGHIKRKLIKMKQENPKMFEPVTEGATRAGGNSIDNLAKKYRAGGGRENAEYLARGTRQEAMEAEEEEDAEDYNDLCVDVLVRMGELAYGECREDGIDGMVLFVGRMYACMGDISFTSEGASLKYVARGPTREEVAQAPVCGRNEKWVDTFLQGSTNLWLETPIFIGSKKPLDCQSVRRTESYVEGGRILRYWIFFVPYAVQETDVHFSTSMYDAPERRQRLRRRHLVVEEEDLNEDEEGDRSSAGLVP